MASRSLVEKADRDNVPCYLETSNPSNVPWYEKHGFRVITKEKAGLMGPPVFYLRRESKSTDKQTTDNCTAAIRRQVAEENNRMKRNLTRAAVFIVVLLFTSILYFFWL